MKRLLSIRWSVAVLLLSVPVCALAQLVPSPYTWSTRYDAMGRIVGTIAPANIIAGASKFGASRTTYDARGNVTRTESGVLSSWQSEAVDPSSWGTSYTTFISVENKFDTNNRKVSQSVVDSSGLVISLTQFSYDYLARIECTATRMNPSVYNALPTSACVLGVEGNFGPDRITKNIYDAAGQLVQVRKALLTSFESAEGTYTFTPNGKTAQVIDGEGNRAELRYDAYDRSMRWVFPSAVKPTAYNDSTLANAVSTAGTLNEVDYEAYTYDAAGNRLTQRRRDGRTLTFAYDALNRPVSKTVPAGCAPIQVGGCTPASATRSVFFGYDLQGHQLSVKFDSATGADGVTNAFDGFGQLTSSTISMAGF
ncbi:hypothetical protein U1700_14265, partial [Sphingomonas sp. RB1R13]